MKYSEFKFDKKLLTCPACFASNIEDYIISISDDHGIQGFNNSKCGSCGTIFTNPRPSNLSMGDFYNDFGSSDEEFIEPSLNYYLNPKRKAEMEKNYLLPLLRYKNAGKLLDFGAGTGWFMKMCQDKGFDVFGIEYMEKVVEAGVQKLDLKNRLVQGSEDNLLDGNKFDIIIANNNIEHLSDPYDFTIKAINALNKNGLLVYTYPCADSYMFKLLEKYSYYFMNPYHLTHFTQNGIRNMLERAGFSDISFELQKESYYWSHGIPMCQGSCRLN
jgi:SAM-dependent methyltransferase